MRRRALLMAACVVPFVGAPVVAPTVLRVPEPILELIGDSILERVFHDALFPKMLYRTGGSSAHVIIDDPVKECIQTPWKKKDLLQRILWGLEDEVAGAKA